MCACVHVSEVTKSLCFESESCLLLLKRPCPLSPCLSLPPHQGKVNLAIVYQAPPGAAGAGDAGASVAGGGGDADVEGGGDLG